MIRSVKLVHAQLEWSEWDEHPPFLHVMYEIDDVPQAMTLHGTHMWALTVYFSVALVRAHDVPAHVASLAGSHLAEWLANLSPALVSSAGLVNDLGVD